MADYNIEPKSGSEPFTLNNNELDFKLFEFWSWSQSDLLSNSLRGVLAEYIVRQGLGIKDCGRIEWNAYDLVTDKGIKIEVKSGAYVQSWHQDKPSIISFNIAPTLGWDAETNEFGSDYIRHADCYVFCLLHHRDKETINPLNLNQWKFYILPTKELNSKKTKQKTIRLSELIKLQVTECCYNELKSAVESISI